MKNIRTIRKEAAAIANRPKKEFGKENIHEYIFHRILAKQKPPKRSVQAVLINCGDGI